MFVELKIRLLVIANIHFKAIYIYLYIIFKAQKHFQVLANTLERANDWGMHSAVWGYFFTIHIVLGRKDLFFVLTIKLGISSHLTQAKKVRMKALCTAIWSEAKIENFKVVSLSYHKKYFSITLITIKEKNYWKYYIDFHCISWEFLMYTNACNKNKLLEEVAEVGHDHLNTSI